MTTWIQDEIWPVWVQASNSTATSTTFTVTSTTATNGQVWKQWAQPTYSYATAGAEIAYVDTWRGWNTTASSTGLTSYTVTEADTTLAWTYWNQNRHAYAPARVVQPRIETPDEATERLARLERRLANEEAYKIQQRVAIVRADALLESILNAAQREHLKKHESFLVRGKSGTLYRIRMGSHGNVDQLDHTGSKVVRTLCAYPTGGVPRGDAMAAQKLMLEADEAEFLRIANRHTPNGIPVPGELLASLVH